MWSYLNQRQTGEAKRGEVLNLAHAVLLIGAMVLLLAGVGGLLGGWGGVLFLGAMGVALFFLNPGISGDLVLRMRGASPLSGYSAPDLMSLLRFLARRAGLPSAPRLYRVPMPAVTAFTVGTRESPAIAVTDGLLRTVNGREMAGILAHEVSHVQRNDMRILGLAATMTQATQAMALLGQILLILNLPLMLVGRVTVSWGAILLLLLAPTVSGLLQLALSRTREYDADLGAVRLTGDPRGLALALSKLERYNQSMFARIFAPISTSPIPSMLRTHPRTEDRIQRLLNLEEHAGSEPPRFHAAS